MLAAAEEATLEDPALPPQLPPAQEGGTGTGALGTGVWWES